MFSQSFNIHLPFIFIDIQPICNSNITNMTMTTGHNRINALTAQVHTFLSRSRQDFAAKYASICCHGMECMKDATRHTSQNNNTASALVTINKVTLRRARLVLGWLTDPGFNSWCRKPISVYNQPAR